ncbi:hypothetical protein KTE35_13560 [Burkholderia multivorans]|nr:hypothetical protein [Burkholderia multivorans]
MPDCTTIAAAHSSLTAIPDAVWSGIVGSLITVLGVLITNLGLSRRHTQQLDHDTRQKAIEREMELRRDIYIPAIESISLAFTTMGSMSDPAVLPAKVTDSYSEMVAKTSKASAIGNHDTVTALGSLADAMRLMFTQLLVSRQPLLDAHGQMVADNSIVERAIGDHGRWVQMQTELLFQGPLDPQKASFLETQINFTQQQINHWTARREASALRLSAAQIEFLKALLQFQPDVARKVIAAITAIRAEFSIVGDNPAAFQHAYARNAANAERFLAEMIAKFEAQFQAQQNGA